MKRFFLILMAALALCYAAAAEQLNPYQSLTDLQNARQAAWDAYAERERQSETRLEEMRSLKMSFSDATMRYTVKRNGKAGENGYACYIALHGGGASDTPAINDQQWRHMQIYYLYSVKNAVYIAPRGVRDTWDTHFNPESYPLYDRLIQNLILFENVDPNRVYLMGYSAGGDGVYAVAPRMADRFAAASMSAGHPNGISMLNTFRLPFLLQAGIDDSAYNRNRVTAEYAVKLDELQAQYPEGFAHVSFIHVGKGHSILDYTAEPQKVLMNIREWYNTGSIETTEADTNAARFLEQYRRDPLPESVIWDLSTRADRRKVLSFYWLSAPAEVKEGVIEAKYDKTTNTVIIERSTINGAYSILLNEQMADLFRPLTVKTPEGETVIEHLPLSPDTLAETTEERGDPNFQFFVRLTKGEDF